MSVNWQNKISNFDIPPPREVWDKIASQLDEEFDPAETRLSQKFLDFEIMPPPFLMENVLNQLLPVEVKPVARIVPLRFKRMAAAAVTIGLILISYFFFFNGSTGSNNGTSSSNLLPPVAVVPSSPGAGTNNADKNQDQSAPDNPVNIAKAEPEKSRFARGMAASLITTPPVKRANLNRVSTANAVSPISVNAPPIYDVDGNIVMDENLVSAPDENYIIVTSPNGEQTKISRKFLKMLCVMNGGSDNYINAENFQWKQKFEEWKSKLLQQAAYMPTANNFLDIMDLKELLEDN